MRPLVRRSVALVAAAVVSAGLVTGCTESGGNGNDKDGGTGSTGTFTPGAQKYDLTKPIVEQSFAVPGAAPDTDTVTVGVLGLESDGKLQVLHLAFTPHFTSQGSTDKISLGTMLDHYSFDPVLVDRKNLKVYSVVGDFETGTSAVTANDQPMYVYAAFAAPEDTGTAFEVRFNDVWQPFVDITPVADAGAKK